jgi:putative thioredoxin
MAKCYAAGGAFEQAHATLALIAEDKISDPMVESARASVELAEQAQAAAAALDENRARLEADANDHAARYDLALALMSANDQEGAINELLELFRRDREWNDSAAKTQLFKLFDALGPTDPLTLTGRRQLSSLVFA